MHPCARAALARRATAPDAPRPRPRKPLSLARCAALFALACAVSAALSAGAARARLLRYRRSRAAMEQPEQLAHFESTGSIPVTLWRYPDTGFSVRRLRSGKLRPRGRDDRGARARSRSGGSAP